MTVGDILWEFRQITALDYEKKEGKPYEQDETIVDDSYEAWQQSLGISPEAIKVGNG